MADKRGSQDLVAGFFDGLTKTIDRKVKEREREIKLKQDLELYGEKAKELYQLKDQAEAKKFKNELELQQVKIEGDATKHKFTKDYDMKLKKDWLGELQGQQPQDYTQPVTGQATVSGEQVPYAETTETPSGRQPAQEVDLGAVSKATQPTMTGFKAMSSQDKMMVTYNALKKIQATGQKLNPTQQAIFKGLEGKLFNTGQDKKVNTATKKELDALGDAINDGAITTQAEALEALSQSETTMRMKGADIDYIKSKITELLPEQADIPEEESSMLGEIKNFISGTTTQKLSQVVDFIVQKFNKTKEEATRIIQKLQGE